MGWEETPRDISECMPVTLVKEYVYCPTIAWLKANIMNEPPTPSMSYAKNLEPKLETIAPKLGLERYKLLRRVKVISKRLGVKGVIDAVILTETEAIPVEAKLKTSKKLLWTKQRHVLAQMLAYAMAVEETMHKPVKRVVALSIEDEKIIEVKIRPWMRQWIENMVAELQRILNKPQPPKPVNKRRCTACQIRMICPYSFTR